MPELPEVETTRRGIAPYLEGHYVERVVVREPRLRWPIPADLPSLLSGQRIQRVERRAKYLLLRAQNGTAILHLGMSGSLRIVSGELFPGRHDHVDLVLADGVCLRLTDPRRFGALLWTADDPLQHPLLAPLGPEPLQDGFDGAYLYLRSRGRSLAVKSFLMNSRIVVGVGNIYANEALFIAGIHPQRGANRISKERYQELASAVRRILEESITQGGTTLRNFLKSDGKPGYFRLKLRVYGRDGQPCRRCGDPIRQKRVGQRSSFYCVRCQH